MHSDSRPGAGASEHRLATEAAPRARAGRPRRGTSAPSASPSAPPHTCRPARTTLRFAGLGLAGLLLLGCAAETPDSRPLAEPTVVSRADWGAREPILPMQPHGIRWITVHHTAFVQEPDRSLEEKMRWLQDFSQEEAPLGDGRVRAPWADIPYHFFIAHDGRIGEGRPLGYAGDTNTNYDPAGHLLIVLEGNFEEEPPTPEQLSSLRRMVRHHAKTWDVPADRVQSHRDYADTLCPGANLYPYLPELRALVAAGAGS